MLLAPEQPKWAKLHPRSRWSGVARHEVSFSTLVDVVLGVSYFISGTEVERRGPDYCVGAGRFLSWCDGIHHLRTKTLEIRRAQAEGECFNVVWRDPEHADMPALPPRQIEINPD